MSWPLVKNTHIIPTKMAPAVACCLAVISPGSDEKLGSFTWTVTCHFDTYCRNDMIHMKHTWLGCTSTYCKHCHVASSCEHWNNERSCCQRMFFRQPWNPDDSSLLLSLVKLSKFLLSGVGFGQKPWGFGTPTNKKASYELHGLPDARVKTVGDNHWN